MRETRKNELTHVSRIEKGTRLNVMPLCFRQCWFSQGGDQGTGLVASLSKEVVKNKDEIVKTASSADDKCFPGARRKLPF